MEEFAVSLQTKRPTKPRNSSEYLKQRKVQDLLAHSGSYAKARQVKEVADQLYEAELQSTVSTFEAESRLKLVKFAAKQKQVRSTSFL